MTRRIFLYSSGTAGDVVFLRAAARRLDALAEFEVELGACRDHVDLLTDLGLPLHVSDAVSTRHGAPLDLAYLAPNGSSPVDFAFRQYDDTRWCGWDDALVVLERQLARHGIGCPLEFDPDDVPMIDFHVDAELPDLTRPIVYVDNRFEEERLAYFAFDVARMAEVFPHFDFACTRPPQVVRDNVLDMSWMTRPQLSKFSERCVLLLGMTRYPFCLTLTEANRLKPKAVCGQDARLTPRFWDYPENPLELLGSMDAVIDFLASKRVERALPQPTLVGGVA